MICLSGDLHHMSLGTGNQAHCDVTEIQVAQRYLRMLEEAGVHVTFFVSGKAFAEECDHLKPIYDSPLVEIGGHNYSCFTPSIWHRFWNKAIGSYNGPAWSQRRDVLMTANIIRKKTGRQIRCWRNHMYMHGPYTERVLAECGIPICSDGVVRSSIGPTRHDAGTWNFPLNVMPDHEHLFHAERTPEWVDAWVRRYNWSDDYGSRSYYVDEWTDLVLEELQQHENHGVVSNMLIHPITLYLCDRFKSFQRILEFLATHETVTMSSAVARSSSRHLEGQLT